MLSCYDDMRGVFDGRAAESEKSISERTIDVFPDSMETGGVVFQLVVFVTIGDAERFRPSCGDGKTMT